MLLYKFSCFVASKSLHSLFFLSFFLFWIARWFCSSCALEANWINEIIKFFNSKELCAKKWMKHAWNENHSIHIIWIIKNIKITNILIECVNNINIDILSLFVDETRIAFRFLESNYAKNFLKIFKFTDFIVLISKIFFSLKLKENVYKILINLMNKDSDKFIIKWLNK